MPLLFSFSKTKSHKINCDQAFMWSFKANVDIIGINPFVYVPPAILAAIFKDAGKEKGNIQVCGLINEKPYVQTLMRYKGEWRLYINTTMLNNSPKRVGELIEISIEFDERNRNLPLHPELLKALDQNKAAANIFEQQSSSLKKEINRYISTLKTPESRERNIQLAINFLLGKNNFIGRDTNSLRRI